MMRVEDLMTTDVLTLSTDATMYDARIMMTDNNFRHIPVMNGQTLKGILSQRDLLKAESSSLISMPDESRVEREKTVKLEEVCNTTVVTIRPQATLLEAAKYIQKHRLGCLPVVEDGILQGIITDSDFVNVAINLLEVATLEDIRDDF